MRKSRVVGSAIVAIMAMLLVAAPASAYWITGWQTNSGWNTIDGCKVQRTITRGSSYAYPNATAEDFWCGRDVGVRAKYTERGKTKTFSSPSWGSHRAEQWGGDNMKFTALKVYHGNH